MSLLYYSIERFTLNKKFYDTITIKSINEKYK